MKADPELDNFLITTLNSKQLALRGRNEEDENDKKKKENDKNEASLVMRLSGPKLKSMLFMGDFVGNNAITVLEKLRGKKPNILKADVWVLPHHGSAMMKLNDKSEEARKYKDLASAGEFY